MKRRGIIAVAAALVATPGIVRAQTGQRQARVGILIPTEAQVGLDVFLDGMRELGFAVGNNLAIETRSADGALERLPALARELVEARVDVIVAYSTPSAAAAKAATDTIPIVFTVVANPVLLGFVASLSRPGGNITGITNMGDEIVLKRLELLRQTAPAATRILAIYHPDDPITAPQLRTLEVSAAALGAAHLAVPVRTTEDQQAAFRQGASWGANGLLRIVGQGAALGIPAAAQALQAQLPGMFITRAEVAAGGLMSYFADNRELLRRAAVPVARILRGDRPADLPVERPVKFELIVNLRTARALGLTIPPAVLLLADEVIE